MSHDSPTPEELRNLARAPQPDQPLLNEQDFDPEEARPPRPLSGNPIMKLAIVGGSLLPIFLFAGIFLGGRQRTNDQNPQPIASTSPSASPSPDAPANQREKLGQTEAQLALEKQRIELERIRQTTSPKKPAQKPVVKTTSQPEPIADRPIAIAPPSYSPPQPVPRIVSPPERVAIAPPEVVKPVISKSARNPKRIAPVEPLPPDTALMRSQSSDPQLQPPIAQEDLANQMLKPKPAIVIAQGEALQVMTTGTKAEGVLQTPIVVDEPIQQKTLLKPQNATDASQTLSDDRFIIVLSEPLKTQDSATALPTGTQVVAQINSISDNGLIKLDAVSAIVNRDRQRTEIALPPGTIQIRGREGSPLIADRYNDKQAELASRDAQMVALNGIRRASEIYTRSDGNLIINNGSINTGRRRSGSDVLAGVVQGVSESLINRAAERNERAIAELENRSDIYQVKAGTPVEVYINYPVQLPRELSQVPEITEHPDNVLPTSENRISRLKSSRNMKLTNTKLLRQTDR